MWVSRVDIWQRNTTRWISQRNIKLTQRTRKVERMTPNGDTTNTSDTARADNPTIYTVYIIYVILFSVLIVLGNSLTTLSILCFTPSKTIVGTVISFVSLAEVCNVLGARIITIYVHFTREFRLSPQSRLCQVQGYFSTAARLTTISLVCLLCVDRTLANFAKDFHHLKWRGTPFRIALSSIVLFSAFAASWPLFGFGKFVPAEETFNAHCIFQPDSFAVFVVCFLGPQLTFIATASCVLIFKSPSAFEASFRASSRVSVKNGRLQNPARHLHRRTLARMCGSIALLYFFCHTPWNVSTGIFIILNLWSFSVCPPKAECIEAQCALMQLPPSLVNFAERCFVLNEASLREQHLTGRWPFNPLSLPRGRINFKFPLPPHQKYYITQYEELGFS